VRTAEPLLAARLLAESGLAESGLAESLAISSRTVDIESEKISTRSFMRSVAFGAIAALPLLSACASPAPQSRFDPAEAAFIRKEGAATIEGQAFLRDPQGQVNVRYAAGEVVRLVPATAYARERFTQLYGERKFIPALLMPTPSQDAEYAAFTRTTKANATGRFSFDKVAPGRYLITTRMSWTPKGSLIGEGGAMYDEVEVTGKEIEPIRVILSGN
jgi:hypothetical protein